MNAFGIISKFDIEVKSVGDPVEFEHRYFGKMYGRVVEVYGSMIRVRVEGYCDCEMESFEAKIIH